MKGYKIILKFRFTHIQQDCVLNRAGQSTIPNSNICYVVLYINDYNITHISYLCWNYIQKIFKEYIPL